MDQLVIYTCPKCGSDLHEICLTSLPPQYQMFCPNCGWTEIKHRKSVDPIRIPYGEDIKYE